ncbi:TPA: oligosaccharide flippase family protein [Enterococcus faecium]
MKNSLAKNAVFNMLYKALTVVFPLITVSYVSHILGAEGIGEVTSAQNFVTYFIMAASLGIPTYGVKAIAKKRAQSDGIFTDIIFSELFIINAFATTISLLIYLSVVFISGYNQLSLIFCSLIVLNYFNIEWVYQGFEEYKYITVRSFIIKLVSLIFMLLFVKKKTDIVIYAGVVCFGIAGNYIMNMLCLNKYVNFTIRNIRLKQHLKPIMVLFVSVIAIELYSLIDVTMLTHMTSSAHVGYFSNAVKIVKMIANTFTAMGAVLLPRLSIYYAEKNSFKLEETIHNFLKIMIVIVVPSCIGIVLVAEHIVLILFGESFISAVRTLQVLAPLVVMMPLSGGVFGQLLLTTDSEKNFYDVL